MCDCDTPEFYSTRVVKSRQDRRCCECYLTIPAGDEHHYDAQRSDGHFTTHRMCRLCRDLHHELIGLSGECCGIPYGGCMEEIHEFPDDGLTETMLAYIQRRKVAAALTRPADGAAS